MADLARFEAIVRKGYANIEASPEDRQEPHPFEVRNIHPDLPAKSRKLFDDGYYAEATFETFKFIEQEVKRLGNLQGTGFALMMQAFNEDRPLLQLNDLRTESEVDEQKGYRHMFAGAQSGVRNPRGHETDFEDSPDVCLDHLSLASVLLRRLDAAGLRDRE